MKPNYIINELKVGEQVTIYSTYDSFSGIVEEVKDGVLSLRLNKKELVSIDILSIYAISRQVKVD
jgi:hypothetical protein